MNNIGLTHFYKFIEHSASITDPQGQGMDAMKPLIESFDRSAMYLKNSVYELEMFEKRFAQFSGKTD